MLVLALVGLLVLFLYINVVRPHRHWQNKGIPYLKPWPILGNMAPVFFKKSSSGDLMQKMYNSFPDKRYFGIYHFFSPFLVVRDPDLIKEITVKHFDAFPEHPPRSPSGMDPFWDKNLFAMKGGDKWHYMRGKLTPQYTSSKLKAMFVLMKECTKQFTTHFEKQGGTVEVELKEAFSKFTNDIISSTALGVTCNSLENAENDVYVMGNAATDVSGIRSLIPFAYNFSPTLMRMLDIRIIQAKASKFFRTVVNEAVKFREETGIIRPDMIYFLMKAQKEQFQREEFKKAEKLTEAKITDEDMTAVVLDFYIAAFDISSTLMSFACYELALNPDIQERARKDIDAALESCNGDITYEAIQKISYLEMIVQETLRKWPPSEHTDRLCTKGFTIEPKLPGEKPLVLEPNSKIWITIFPIHRDPNNFPDPLKFDPERFSDENRGKIKPFTFLPFGVGPRSCVGSRFAILETKLIIFDILSKFELLPVKETQIPLTMSKGSFNMITEKGVTLALKPRNL